MTDEQERAISQTVQRAADRAREHAEDHFPETDTTMQLLLWDDSDFSITIQNSIDNGSAHIREVQEIDYQASEGSFVYRHYETRHGWQQERLIEETILEAYP